MTSEVSGKLAESGGGAEGDLAVADGLKSVHPIGQFIIASNPAASGNLPVMEISSRHNPIEAVRPSSKTLRVFPYLSGRVVSPFEGIIECS